MWLRAVLGEITRRLAISLLESPRAIAVNIEIMRAFVRLRMIFSSNKELARRLDELEVKTDAKFKVVFEAKTGIFGRFINAIAHRLGTIGRECIRKVFFTRQTRSPLGIDTVLERDAAEREECEQAEFCAA